MNKETIDIKWKDQFKSKLPALVKMSGFSDVEVLVVIRDADEDANAAFKSTNNFAKAKVQTFLEKMK